MKYSQKECPMPAISANWHNEQHSILIAYYQPEWDWEDYYTATLNGIEMVAQEQHGVVVIHYQPTLPVERYGLFANLKWSRSVAPQNVIGTIVVISQNSFDSRFIANILGIWKNLVNKKSKNDIVIVNSMQEALKVAQNHLHQS
jgi:hypothetical protein